MKNIATALVAVQSKMHNLGKDKEAYNYSYLTLAKIIEETRTILAENGLAVLQPLDNVNGEPAIRTVLLHTSGESIEGTYPITKAGMKQVNDAQQMGAAVTYARRYGLAAILNIAQVDDDAASLTTQAPQTQQQGTW